MKEPRPDDERLAALLDGRLTERQRDGLLAHLAADDEDYQVFLEAADILAEAAEAAPGEGATPHGAGSRLPPSAQRRAARWPHATPRRITLAVAAAGLVVLGALAARGRAAEAGHPLRLAARLQHAGQGLPEGWAEQRPWTATRGEASAQAAQAGALLVDLAVAVAARDSADTWLLATQLRRRFDPQATSTGPLPQVAARAGEPAEALEPLVRDATRRLEARLDPDLLRLGAWAEAARLAAERRDDAFFRSRATGRMLRRAERLTAADPDARAAVSHVQAVRATQGAWEWEALGGALRTLLGALAADPAPHAPT